MSMNPHRSRGAGWERHAEFRSAWRNSDLFTQTADVIRPVLSRDGPKIDTAVCLALGHVAHPTYAGSLKQLVAFESWVDLLTSHGCVLKRVVFQDPSFTNLDRRILEMRGYEIVNEPTGEDLISSSTLLFAPGIPTYVVMPIFARVSPALSITTHPKALEPDGILPGYVNPLLWLDRQSFCAD